MDEVLKFLKENPTYFLATVDGDHPRVRPFGTIALFEEKLYFQTGHVKDVYRQLIANPQIEQPTEASGFEFPLRPCVMTGTKPVPQFWPITPPCRACTRRMTETARSFI